MQDMRFVAAKRNLPRNFISGHPHTKGLIAEADIYVTKRSRLAAKLVVFDTQKNLRYFWNQALGLTDTNRCLGIVSTLCYRRDRYVKNRDDPVDTWMVGDGRYFCVIGLLKHHLGCNVISHEAVHAGFAYAKRVKRNPFAKWNELDEELVAYPSGIIFAAIIEFLYKKKLMRQG